MVNRAAAASVVGLVLTLFASPVLAASSAAAEPPAQSPRAAVAPAIKNGQLYALVVGLSKYKDGKIPKLDLAAKDAKAFGDFLKDQSEIFKETHVTYLLNEKATKSELEKYLYYTLPKAGKEDTVILFFSGHGASDPIRPNDFLFLPYDTEPEYLGTSAVKMSGLEFLKGVNAERVLMIADTCYAGGFSTMKAKSVANPLERFLQEVRGSSGRAVMTSATNGQLSWEKPNLKNSVFTHNLLEGLKGKADKDRDGVVTLSEAYEYAYAKTKEETNGHQQPQLEQKVVAPFPLSFVGPRVPLSELKRRVLKSAEDGDAAALDGLLAHFSEIDTRNDQNDTPLIMASRNGKPEAVKLLLERGATVDAQNLSGETALCCAAEFGHADAVKLLLASGTEVDHKNSEGITPLALASAKGHLAVVEMLLDEGASFKARTNAGESPLCLAASAGHLDVVKLLVDWGAEAKTADVNSSTALTKAARAGHAPVVKFLLSRAAGIQMAAGGLPERQMMLSTLRGDLERLKDALSRKADVDARAESGDTALTFAAGLGQLEVVKLLLSKGADVHVRGPNGVTAVMCAAKNGQTDVVRLFLDRTADLNAKDENQDTALALASQTGHVDTVKLLHSKGADVNARNREGETPLIVSARNGHLDVVRFLVSSGAQVEAKNKAGDTALIVASAGGQADITKFLVARKANVNAKNNSQSTSLIMAAKNGHTSMVKLLLAAGADVHAEDWEGKTALMLASEKDQQEVVDLLKTR